MSIYSTIYQMNTPFEPLYKYSIRADWFLAQSGGNLLVNSGRPNMRLQLLLHELDMQSGNTIILTSSHVVESALVEAAANRRLNRRLILCSERYPNYDPLYGIGTAAGARFFAEVAEDLGYRDRSALVGYFTAFTELYRALEQRPLSLYGLCAFARHPEAELLQLAAETDEAIYTDLIESAAGSKSFRDLLRLLHSEFRGFSAVGAGSGLSMITAAEADKPSIICIRPGGNPRLVARLFAAEVSAALDRPFHLMLAESRLLCDKDFAEVFAAKKNEQGITALFTENIMAYADRDPLGQNFARKIILLDGTTDPADLQKSLSALGSYQHFTETDSVSKPMKLPILPSLKSSTSRGVTQYERARVLYEEVVGNQAVLFSSAAGLIVAGHLKT